MRKSSLLVAAALLVSLTACKKEQPPAPAPPPAAVPKPAKPVQAHISSAEGAQSLDFTKKKDPFKPFVAEPPKPLPGMRTRLPGGGDIPIQMYEVNQFKVIGLIAGLKENKAMVIDPAGKSYVLKEGMAIGKYGGRIMAITGTYIEVREQYREDSGRVKTRTVR